MLNDEILLGTKFWTQKYYEQCDRNWVWLLSWRVIMKPCLKQVHISLQVTTAVKYSDKKKKKRGWDKNYISGFSNRETRKRASKFGFLKLYKNLSHSRPLFLYFCLFNTVSIEVIDYKFNLPMNGFKLRICGVVSDHSTNWAKTTARFLINFFVLGGSPGLVIMGGDSCSEGCGFESQHRILDGHFSRLFVVKIVMFVWKRGRGWAIYITFSCCWAAWLWHCCWGSEIRGSNPE